MVRLQRFYLLSMCLLLASCASLVGPREVEVRQDRLQASLDRKFPLHARVLELFEITLTHPEAQILPELDRVALSLDVAMQPRFGGTPLTGQLTLSGRLALDLARNAVLLQDARIDRFNLDRWKGERPEQTARVANLLLDRVVSDITLYTFQPEDLRRAGVQFRPTRIVTKPRALVVTLEPQR